MSALLSFTLSADLAFESRVNTNSRRERFASAKPCFYNFCLPGIYLVALVLHHCCGIDVVQCLPIDFGLPVVFLPKRCLLQIRVHGRWAPPAAPQTPPRRTSRQGPRRHPKLTNLIQSTLLESPAEGPSVFLGTVSGPIVLQSAERVLVKPGSICDLLERWTPPGAEVRLWMPPLDAGRGQWTQVPKIVSWGAGGGRART